VSPFSRVVSPVLRARGERGFGGGRRERGRIYHAGVSDDSDPGLAPSPATAPLAPIPDSLRPALAELEAYLDGEPVEKLSTHVLVLASTLVLGDAGFDLDRYEREARTFYELTPEHDRVLASFPDAMGYYLALRLMTGEDGEVDRAAARARLEAARAALAARADSVEAEFPRVAEGFRRLLEETAGDAPPEDRLWQALARRIGDRLLPDWLLRAATARS